MDINIRNINNFIVVGDRVLIKPESEEGKTASGLYLPPGITEKEKIQSGYVIKVGPGYVTAAPPEDEPWKSTEEKIKYIPLQAKQGDLALFLRKEAYEIEFDREKYLIVPHSAILLLIRDEDLL